MTKIIEMMGRSVLSILTIATFALLPFAGVAVAQEQEAEVCEATSAFIVSDSDTQVGGVDSVAVDNDTVTEGNQVPGAWTAVIPGATWIWSDAQNSGVTAPGIKMFTREFEWSSDATSTAILEIASDNTYSVTVNTQDAGGSLDENNFSSSDIIDISGFLVDGTNSIQITVENLGPDDNPAGLLYRIDLAGEDCEPVLPVGDITSPDEGEIVSGTTTLVAVYTDDNPEDEDAVQWAVRVGECEVSSETVFGNVDGFDDDSVWNGSLFTAEIDTTTVENGEYCFIFNPTDDEGETDVRETVSFFILNEEDPEEFETSITVTKVIVNDDGGTATTSDFQLLVGAMEVESGVEAEIEAGTYVVAEFGTSTSDYVATFSGDCDADGDITINEGDNLECTITNNDIPTDALQCEAIELDLFSDESAPGWVAVDNATSTEGNQIPEEWTADIDGATWIWVDAQNDGDAATTTETYTREFEWSSDATTTATLMIATDNSYSVSVNGVEVGSSTDEVNFTLETQDIYDVSDEMVDGTNTLEIVVTNADNGGENPAGLLYSLAIDGFECEDEPVTPPGDDDDDDQSSSGGGGGSVFAGDRADNDDDDDDDGEVLGEATGGINYFVPGTGGSVLGVGFPATGAGGTNGLAVIASVGMLTLLLGTLFLVRKTLVDLEKTSR
jgi:hypothetical protein